MKKYLFTFLAGAAVLGAIVLGFWFWRGQANGTRFGVDRAAVIRQIQGLNRLETASYDIDKIIEAGTGYDKLRQFLFGDKLLLVAHGTVIAGFDLSTLATKDIQGSGTEITVRLPPPRILSTSLDNAKTRVFDRRQGLLTKGDAGLESDARQEAQTAITLAACDGGILDTANEQARKQLVALLTAAGFTRVDIITQSAACTL